MRPEDEPRFHRPNWRTLHDAGKAPPACPYVSYTDEARWIEQPRSAVPHSMLNSRLNATAKEKLLGRFRTSIAFANRSIRFGMPRIIS